MYILKRKELAQVLACAKSASATADCVSRLLLTSTLSLAYVHTCFQFAPSCCPSRVRIKDLKSVLEPDNRGGGGLGPIHRSYPVGAHHPTWPPGILFQLLETQSRSKDRTINTTGRGP